MKVNILLVDDDQDVNYSFKSLLEAEGYCVYTAFNKDQAKAIVKERDIHFVIMDYLLEDTTGVEIARTLKEIDRSLKIMFVSGFLAVLDIVNELEFYGSRVFLKPVDPGAFLETVNAIIMEP